MNRKTTQLSVIVMAAISQVSAQTTNPPSQYESVLEDGTRTVSILRDKNAIDTKLKAEKDLVAPGEPDLSAVDWHKIIVWRRDPVTSSPMSSVDDIKSHAEELYVAVDGYLAISESGKAELRDKIATGSCTLGPMESPYFQAMVNRSSVIWKGEVEESLFKKTQACEFFLESESMIVAVIMDCGNFTFYFSQSRFTTKAEASMPKSEPIPPPVVIPPVSTQENQPGIINIDNSVRIKEHVTMLQAPPKKGHGRAIAIGAAIASAIAGGIIYEETRHHNCAACSGGPGPTPTLH